ncbi:cell wall-active antibiotics response protein LiaF [Aquibacillus koreensis]|uniref:Cell wall-active antibiotics response protein LiaF n=1 Tax=Aquibacillus koreensis TaxID=279446 RepID=A0A9X3WMU5_9BACI|nr:cell wall-active antibiotics response protein LiaF [Aquibacillus koreensis]MCT2535576.1 cell wall-active antibiotics response protein LiaF [Aquibacillus koreensis]MDC3420139.1 cell wall-active antibiotics response protein LiaF [Aquibacillus koreensis]
MKHNFVRNIIAIIIILLGIALVLTNVGVVDWEFAEAWSYIYPTFFVLLGLKWMWDGFKGKGGLTAGSFLTIFGGLLLLDRFEIITFTFGDVYKLWPLLIVYIGFSIIGTSSKKKKKKKFQFIFDSDEHENSEKMHGKKQKFAIGDHKFNTPNWKVEPMELWNAVGDYHLDFTKAFIPDKEIPIRIQGWAGDIRILMPENLEFSLEAHVKAGDIHVFGESSEGISRELSFVTPNYDESTRKLNIYLNLKAGSIRVDKV